MKDILIRGVSEEVVERIDAQAAALGLSRNEFLRRKLDTDTYSESQARLTAADWKRSAATFSDLEDPVAMDAAWR